MQSLQQQNAHKLGLKIFLTMKARLQPGRRNPAIGARLQPGRFRRAVQWLEAEIIGPSIDYTLTYLGWVLFDLLPLGHMLWIFVAYPSLVIIFVVVHIRRAGVAVVNALLKYVVKPTIDLLSPRPAERAASPQNGAT